MHRRLDDDRLIGLFALACLLFGYPIMGLWDWPVRVMGVPLFPLAIFVCWAGLIAALAWLMERPANGHHRPTDEGAEPADGLD